MRYGVNIPLVKAKKMLVVAPFLKYGATIYTAIVDVVIFAIFQRNCSLHRPSIYSFLTSIRSI